GGKPGCDPRLDSRPVRPDERFSWAGDEGWAHKQSKLARGWHVDRLRRDQLRVATAISDRVDERRLRGAVLAENIAGQALDLRPSASESTCLSGTGKAILPAQDAIDLLCCEARELLRRGAGPIQAQLRGFSRFRLAGAETAVGVLGVEHGEH